MQIISAAHHDADRLLNPLKVKDPPPNPRCTKTSQVQEALHRDRGTQWEDIVKVAEVLFIAQCGILPFSGNSYIIFVTIF